MSQKSRSTLTSDITTNLPSLSAVEISEFRTILQDIVDSMVSATEDGGLREFSSSINYASGVCAIINGRLLVSNTSITASALNLTEWNIVEVDKAIPVGLTFFEDSGSGLSLLDAFFMVGEDSTVQGLQTSGLVTTINYQIIGGGGGIFADSQIFTKGDFVQITITVSGNSTNGVGFYLVPTKI